MIIEIKNIPNGSKVKTVEFKIELEPETQLLNKEPDLNVPSTTEAIESSKEKHTVKPDESVKAPEFETTTESFPPSTPSQPKEQTSSESVTLPPEEHNTNEPDFNVRGPKLQVTTEGLAQPFKEIPKEMLDMDL